MFRCGVLLPPMQIYYIVLTMTYITFDLLEKEERNSTARPLNQKVTCLFDPNQTKTNGQTFKQTVFTMPTTICWVPM